MNDQTILSSWQRNVDAWCAAVRDGEISSRVAVTDGAILAAIREIGPKSLLDVGCGEGWLLRGLEGSGIRRVGIDGVKALVQRARELGGGEFYALTYRELAAGAWHQPMDMVVFNFSLLGEADCEGPLAAVRHILTPGGRCLIQTLHPAFCDFGERYESGWRPGSWSGFSNAFCDPPPWFFRTLDNWLQLFRRSALVLEHLREPVAKGSVRPASIIFELSTRD